MAQQPPSSDIPLRWPLVIEPANRDETTDKDAKLVNCWQETQTVGGQREPWIYKRPGLLQQSRPPAGNASGFGVYNWLGDIYSIFGATMYKNGVALVGVLDTTGGVYVFTSCLGATPRLIFGNGAKAYYYDSGGGIVHITDVDFPAAFVKGWAYLDGTIYIMRATAHIQGSDINDPASWDVLNDILAQIEPDQGVALAKQLVYVVAFKQWSTEAFYDAGNATGSPLGPVQGAKVNYGCVSSGSVQDIDGALLWVCTSRTAGTQVMMLDQLKADIVSTKPIERLLQTLDWTTTYSWQISLDGHRFYLFTSVAGNLTLAFDLDEKAWHQWTDVSGNYMPIVAATFDSSQRAILQHATDGRLYYCSSNYTNDNGVKIVSDIITPNFDGGVQSRIKTLYREYFVGDKTPGSMLEIRANDSDYAPGAWTPPRLVDMSQERPVLDDCGSFVRRAQWIRHQSNTRMRLKALELQMEVGTG